jgi:protein-tyrosine phosphatase
MRILFVCLGNICRSPTAEGVFRALSERTEPRLVTRVDSAGTAGYHIGDSPDPRTQAAAARRGYDLAMLRARQVQREDFSRFDLVLAMDRANLKALRQLAPRGARARIELMLALSRHPTHDEVPDPYYGETADFDLVVELLETASRDLLRQIRDGHLGPSVAS